MSAIDVYLDRVAVTDGQGVGEGAFELNIEVQERQGNDYASKLHWPAFGETRKVKKNGDPRAIGAYVGTYIFSPTSSPDPWFRVQVTEEDTGTLGRDETGEADLRFGMSPTMDRTEKSATITLRSRGGNEGQVRVTLVAQPR
jgi:hypothetical protein